MALSGDSRFESWQGPQIRQALYAMVALAKGIRHLTSNLGDSRFESWQGRNILSHAKIDFIPNIYWHYCLLEIRCLVAQWIRHLTTNQGIPGSSHGKVVIFCLILR